MSRNLLIRPATVDDAEALQNLYAHLSLDNERCPTELARDNLLKLAAYAGSAVLVGVSGDVIVVTCTLIVIPNLTRGGAAYALIENVVTHADHRGQGFGTLVLDAASDRAWEHGCYKIMLSTGSSKAATHAFYERAGFAQSRKGFQKRRIAARRE